MERWRAAVAVLAVTTAFVAGEARAQGTGALAGAPAYPVSSFFLPVESAFLQSKVDLQVYFTTFDVGRTSATAVVLALEAKYAIADRIQVGLTIPFLNHGAASGGGVNGSSTDFGNIVFDLKALLVGRSGSELAVSLFLNSLLPTTSANVSSRSFTLLHGGLTVSSFFAKSVTVGVTIGDLAALVSQGDNSNAVFSDFFFGVSPIPQFNIQLAMQILYPVSPDTASPGVSIAPAVQFFPIPAMHVDLGVRIAANDNGKLYTTLGRAALLFAVGAVF
jgi:hypothetical protein